MFFESDYKILSNEKIAKDVYKMRLEGDTSHITAPGQFVNIKLDGKFLRRPISVCDCEENVITIIYKVVGEGTEQMSNLKIGKMLNVLTGLGNGYDISKSTKPLLIGGGGGGGGDTSRRAVEIAEQYPHFYAAVAGIRKTARPTRARASTRCAHGQRTRRSSPSARSGSTTTGSKTRRGNSSRRFSATSSRWRRN